MTNANDMNSKITLGAGTEGRNWVDGESVEQSAKRYPINEDTVSIPMRDGIRLSALRWLPEIPEGTPVPALIMSNGYSGVDDLLKGTLEELASSGYAVFLVRSRGTAPSEGETGLYEKYGPDGHDVIEWLAAQPFCNGRVGSIGASLLGMAQWLAAREGPEHLKVMVPDDAVTSAYDHLWYVGGMALGPGREARKSIPGVEMEYALAVTEPYFGDFWRERSVEKGDMQAVARRGVAALITSGWSSYLISSAKSYTWMREAGGGDRLKLIIGPWSHASMLTRDSFSYAVPPSRTIAPTGGFEYKKMWLDRFLKDEGNGVDKELPVLIWVEGPEKWRFEANWPLPDERRTRLQFSGKRSGSGSSINDGSLCLDSPEPSKATYHYEPGVSYNAVAVNRPAMVFGAGGPSLEKENLPDGFSRRHGRVICDKTSYEKTALTWTSPVLAEPVEITGYPRLVFWASVSRPDADFVVEITDVAPKEGGGWASTQVTHAFMRAAAQFSRTGPVSLSDTDVYKFEIELQPMSYVFKSGHRIRVALQGAANDPTLEVVWHGPGLAKHAFSYTVVNDDAYTCTIDLPVIGKEISFQD